MLSPLKFVTFQQIHKLQMYGRKNAFKLCWIVCFQLLPLIDKNLVSMQYLVGKTKLKRIFLENLWMNSWWLLWYKPEKLNPQIRRKIQLENEFFFLKVDKTKTQNFTIVNAIEMIHLLQCSFTSKFLKVSAVERFYLDYFDC